jgi:hypothetical protein
MVPCADWVAGLSWIEMHQVFKTYEFAKAWLVLRCFAGRFGGRANCDCQGTLLCTVFWVAAGGGASFRQPSVMCCRCHAATNTVTSEQQY